MSTYNLYVIPEDSEHDRARPVSIDSDTWAFPGAIEEAIRHGRISVADGDTVLATCPSTTKDGWFARVSVDELVTTVQTIKFDGRTIIKD